jgi:hypothetical protein
MLVSAFRAVVPAVLSSAVVLLLAGGVRGAADDRTLAVPGRANAHVSLASNGRFLVAAWAATAAGGETDVFAAVSRDGGRTFGAPVRVNSTPGDVRVNGEQPPRVALLSRASGALPEVAVVWTTKGSAGTRLLWSRSRDGGKTFAASVPVPDTDAPGNRGWEALAAGPGGRLFTAWLDHRRLATPGQTPAGHQHGDHAEPGVRPQGQTPAVSGDGVAMAQLSQLYVGSLDGTVPPRPVTGGVCYCCKTALAQGAGDALYVAWRHVYPGNMRDIAFSVSRDGGRTFASPVRVSEDKWQIEGCPDDGPAMGVDGQGRVHLVWPSVLTEQGGPVKALFHAMSADGQRFTARQRIPTEGHAHHPQLTVAPDGALVVLWDESGTGTRRIASATGRVDTGGRVAFTRGVALNEVGSYPVVAPAGAGRWLAMWTTGSPSSSTIRVATLPR